MIALARTLSKRGRGLDLAIVGPQAGYPILSDGAHRFRGARLLRQPPR